MAEIQTADGANGVTVQSPQSDPKPKSDETESDAPEPKRKPRKGSAVTTKLESKAPKLNSRGVPITQWDNDDADPNKRKSIAEDPTGESNLFEGH